MSIYELVVKCVCVCCVVDYCKPVGDEVEVEKEVVKDEVKKVKIKIK